jgi:putative transposase
MRKAFNERRDDAEVTKLIQLVMRERPTYGYKRVTAMLNSRFRRRFNKKRIYRLMRKAGLLLPRSPIVRPKHPGTGKVMVAHPNTRWASDCFEIHCWNDEKVYVTFAIDCCDREVIHFIATPEDISAEVVQVLMFRSVEIRFGSLRAPRQLEWLTDRGSIYKSKETQQVARDLNLKPCFTAAYSPASNGIAEAFVGTFKRDYVYMNDCASADAVINAIPAWIEDYNEHAPHAALAMRSPRQYQRALNLAG